MDVKNAKEEKYREMDGSVVADTSFSEAVESTEEDAEDDTEGPKFAGEVIEKHMKVRDEAAEASQETEVLGNVVSDILRDAGIKVHEMSAEQAREMANRGQRMNAAKKALDTAVGSLRNGQATVMSSAEGK